MMYIPGVIFLFLASAVISLPFAISMKNKPLAILSSVCLAALILNLWAYFAIGGFDIGFIVLQLVIGLGAAVLVTLIVNRNPSRLQLH